MPASCGRPAAPWQDEQCPGAAPMWDGALVSAPGTCSWACSGRRPWRAHGCPAMGRQSGRRTPSSSGQRGKLSPSAGGSGCSTAIFNLNHSLPHLLGTGLLHTKLCSVGQSNRKTHPDPCRAAMLMPLERVRWRAAQPRGPGWGRGARAVPPLSHPGHLLGAAVSGSRTRSCAAHPGSGTGSPPALQP